MTVKELIAELRKLPGSTKVLADDGNGWGVHGVYLDYDKGTKTVGIYGKSNEEDE